MLNSLPCNCASVVTIIESTIPTSTDLAITWEIADSLGSVLATGSAANYTPGGYRFTVTKTQAATMSVGVRYTLRLFDAATGFGHTERVTAVWNDGGDPITELPCDSYRKFTVTNSTGGSISPVWTVTTTDGTAVANGSFSSIGNNQYETEWTQTNALLLTHGQRYVLSFDDASAGFGLRYLVRAVYHGG
jgi:hypothetical protein